MTVGDRKIIPLLTYGWVDHSETSLKGIHTSSDAIRAYVQSPEFGTSFVGPNRDVAPNIHGPFRRECILESDFEPISRDQFRARIAAIRQTEGFAVKVPREEWDPVEKIVGIIADRNTSFYALRFTEKDKPLRHEWGSVLELFREFICFPEEYGVMDRLIFGYD